MRGSRTRTIERTASVMQFIDLCVASDKKAARFIEPEKLQDLDEKGLVKKVFLLTTVSSVSRYIAASDPDIFRLRIGSNLVAVNIAKWGLGSDHIDSMIGALSPDDLLLKNGDGVSMAEMVARKGSEASMVALINKSEPAALKALSVNDGESVCRILWHRGSASVRIELACIGSAFGDLETFKDIDIIGSSTKEIAVDVGKARNRCWNDMLVRLYKLSKEARRESDAHAAESFSRIRRDMSMQKDNLTSDMIVTAQARIDNAEMGRRFMRNG